VPKYEVTQIKTIYQYTVKVFEAEDPEEAKYKMWLWLERCEEDITPYQDEKVSSFDTLVHELPDE